MSSVDLENLCLKYEEVLAKLLPTMLGRAMPVRAGPELAKHLPPVLAAPSCGDLAWLIDALKHPQRRWLIAGGLELARSVDEALFQPIMEAAMDTHPVYCADFVRPCVRIFGHHRVSHYLTDVLEHGTEAQKKCAKGGLYEANGEQLTMRALATYRPPP